MLVCFSYSVSRDTFIDENLFFTVCEGFFVRIPPPTVLVT